MTQQGANVLKILLSGLVVVVVGSAGEFSAGAQPLPVKPTFSVPAASGLTLPSETPRPSLLSRVFEAPRTNSVFQNVAFPVPQELGRPVQEKPRVVCGTLVIPVDPKFDDKMRQVVPRGGVQFPIGKMGPLDCK